MGIVGLPNVGKSSLFNLLCEQACAAVRQPTPQTVHSRRERLAPPFAPLRRVSHALRAAADVQENCACRFSCACAHKSSAWDRVPFSVTSMHPCARLTCALRADPFCTIEPNESRCAVPDERYDWLCGTHATPAAVVARADALRRLVEAAEHVPGVPARDRHCGPRARRSNGRGAGQRVPVAHSGC